VFVEESGTAREKNVQCWSDIQVMWCEIVKKIGRRYTPPPLRLSQKLAYIPFQFLCHYSDSYLTSRKPIPWLRIFHSDRTDSRAS